MTAIREDRGAILQMVAEGRITATQAAELLVALDAARIAEGQPLPLTDPLREPAVMSAHTLAPDRLAPHARLGDDFGEVLGGFGASVMSLVSAALDEARWGLSTARVEMDRAAQELRGHQSRRRARGFDVTIVR